MFVCSTIIGQVQLYMEQSDNSEYFEHLNDEVLEWKVKLIKVITWRYISVPCGWFSVSI